MNNSNNSRKVGGLRSSYHVGAFDAVEALLCTFIIAVIVLDMSVTFTLIPSGLGVIFCLLSFYQYQRLQAVGLCRDWLKPVAPLVIYIIWMWLILPLNADGAVSTMRGTFAGLIIIATYLTVRRTGRTWAIEIGFAVGILTIASFQRFGIGGMKNLGDDRIFFDVIGDGGQLNPNAYGVYLVASVFFSAKYLLTDRFRSNVNYKKFRDVLALLSIVVACQQVILVTGSRGAQLVLFLSLGALFLIWGKGKRGFSISRLLMATGAGVVALLVMYSLLKNSVHFERVENLIEMLTYGHTNNEGSVNHRLEMYVVGAKLWMESPIWGHGMGAFIKKSGMGAYSHSNITELLVSCGTVGYGLWLSVQISAWRHLIRYKNKYKTVGRTWLWLAAALACMAGVYEIFSITYYSKISAVYYGALYAYAFGYFQENGTRRVL